MALTDPDLYNGSHGGALIDSVAFGYAEFSLNVDIGVIEGKRGGKKSNTTHPGKIKVTGAIKKYIRDGSDLGAVLNAIPTTGAAETLHAGLTYPTADTGENITDMTDTAPATPSKIRLTALTAAITTAGQAILYGTDAANNKISEVITILTLALNAYVTSSLVYKTLTHVALFGCYSATGTLGVTSIVGASTVVPGDPKYFTLTWQVVKNASNVIVIMPRCWYNSFKGQLGDADAAVDASLDFQVEDADNITETYA